MKYINIESQTYTGKIDIYDENKEDIFYSLDIKAGESLFNISTLGHELYVETKEGITVGQSERRTYSIEQLQINEGRITDFYDGVPINYFLTGNKINPQKIIFSMPSFSVGDLSKKYQVSKFNSLPEDLLSTTLIIALQDDYSVYGTYLSFDDEGQPISNKIHSFIANIVEKYNISFKDTLFFGCSKGGTIATIFGSKYPESTIINVVGHKNLDILTHYSYSNIGALLDPLTKKSDPTFTSRDFEAYQAVIESKQKLYYISGNIDAGTSDNFFHDKSNIELFFVEGGHSAGISAGKPIYFSLIREFICSGYQQIRSKAHLHKFEAVESEQKHLFIFGNLECLVDSENSVSFISFLNYEGKIEGSTEIFKLSENEKIKGFASKGFKAFDYSSMLPSLMNKLQITTWSHQNKKKYIFEIPSNPIVWRSAPKTRQVYSTARVLRSEIGTLGNRGLLYLKPKDFWLSRNTELIITAYFIKKENSTLAGYYSIGSLGDNDKGRFFINKGLKLDFIDNIHNFSNCYINIEVKDPNNLTNYIYQVVTDEGEPYTTPVSKNYSNDLVILGDSITKYYHRELEFYSNKTVIDFGMPGISTEYLLKIIDSLSLQDYDFGMIVLMIGTNDLISGLNEDEFLTNYKKIIETLKKIFSLHNIIILPILPISDSTFKNGENSIKDNSVILRANELINKVAQEFGILFYQELVNNFMDDNGRLQHSLTNDGLHLNETGRMILSYNVNKLLERVKK
ncbi:GDSL-type esterase/lipase family protein [Lactococcus formosensis]|uniref:GDSL-type esterase/lipase family protein n=1 Tax=Lactococcus formosensis TaxID=1281486 RepID=UPI002435B6B7|nr:GDSL-type esterase/lipase family protein [Lactococcus formosensis]MDG6126098.1 GDSL-type esterase/lipase family protein [Lactococcus formosensis]MDG6187901.1 GDSL-type esterase/lipase family protein [Lactococcus formosensis]